MSELQGSTFSKEVSAKDGSPFFLNYGPEKFDDGKFDKNLFGLDLMILESAVSIPSVAMIDLTPAQAQDLYSKLGAWLELINA